MTVVDSASMLTERQWLQPDADWLDWDQAAFFFSPTYLRPGAPLLEHVKQQLRFRHEKSYEVQSISETCIAVDCDNVRLTIDASSGLLHLQPSPASGAAALSESDFAPVGRPLAFLKQLDVFRGILPQFREGVFALSHAADLFVSSQHRHLAEALRLGHAVVVGRWHRAREPFRIIAADQWRNFRLDWPAHGAPVVARAGNDEVIYSPMVMPVVRPTSPKQRWESEAKAYLIDRINHSRDVRIEAETLQKEVTERWPELSRRAFERAREDAISATGAVTYRAQGRPRKNGARKK